MKTLEDVYRSNMKDLYNYLLSLSAHPQTAEDLLQDTFVKAYEHLESYRGEKVRPWLFRVAHNAFIDWYRKEQRQQPAEPAVLDRLLQERNEPDPQERYLLQERLRSWLKAVGSLPLKGRQVILLRDYYDFTYQDISRILNISLTSVKVTLFRARQKVKEVMEDELREV